MQPYLKSTDSSFVRGGGPGGGSYMTIKWAENPDFDNKRDIHMSSEITMQMRQMATNTIWNWHSSCTNCKLHILEVAAELTMPI